LSQDPNPAPALEELEDVFTNDQIDVVIDQIIGKLGGIITHRYNPSRTWLWRQWYATVLYHSFGHALGNMMAALMICVVLCRFTHGDWKVWEFPLKVIIIVTNYQHSFDGLIGCHGKDLEITHGIDNVLVDLLCWTSLCFLEERL
jgi:hypothetical protein